MYAPRSPLELWTDRGRAREPVCSLSYRLPVKAIGSFRSLPRWLNECVRAVRLSNQMAAPPGGLVTDDATLYPESDRYPSPKVTTAS